MRGVGKRVDEMMEVGGMLEGRVSSEGSEGWQSWMRGGREEKGRGEGGEGEGIDGGVRGGGKGRR